MDLVEKIVWILLIVCLVSFFSLNSAYGEDKIEVLRLSHPDNPTVCIMQPEPIIQDRFHEDVFKLTVDSVLSWQNEMSDYTDGNWFMPMFYYEYEEHFDKVPEDFPECNIFIEYREYNTGVDEGTTNNKALGWTGFDFSKSWHKYAYVMVYLKSPEVNPHISLCIGCEDNNDITITFEQKPLPSNTISRIIMHEFGHSLGIGHYQDDRERNNTLPSLMHPNLKPFEENSFKIEDVDKEVLKMIYNKDGFGGQRGFNPYFFDIVEKHSGEGWRLE